MNIKNLKIDKIKNVKAYDMKTGELLFEFDNEVTAFKIENDEPEIIKAKTIPWDK